MIVCAGSSRLCHLNVSERAPKVQSDPRFASSERRAELSIRASIPRQIDDRPLQSIEPLVPLISVQNPNQSEPLVSKGRHPERLRHPTSSTSRHNIEDLQ